MINETVNPVELKQFKDCIELNNVSFSYDGKNKIIDDMSLILEKGKTYAFVGESGGGKSTILQLLLRMYDATSGEVLIDGVNIKDYLIASLREHI